MLMARRKSGCPSRRRLGAAACGLLIGCGPAAGGAWLQIEGQGQIIFRPELMLAKRRFDKRGGSATIDRFVKQDNATTVEYGLRRDLTLILSTNQRVETFSTGGDPQRVYTSGIGGGARVELWRAERLIVSAQITGQTTLERSLPALPSRFGPRHEVDGRLLAGYSFEIAGIAAFAEAQAGYRWRSTRSADEARLDLTVGIRPVPRLLLLVQAFNAAALQSGSAGSRERQRQHKLQASAVFDLTDTWSVQAGAFASVAGRSALRERGVVLGLWRKF